MTCSPLGLIMTWLLYKIMLQYIKMKEKLIDLSIVWVRRKVLFWLLLTFRFRFQKINTYRYFAILRLRRSGTVFIEHGNKGMGLNTQIHVQEAKAFLSNYVHTLGDMMPDSKEVRTNLKLNIYFHFGWTQTHFELLLISACGESWLLHIFAHFKLAHKAKIATDFFLRVSQKRINS